LNYDGHSDFAFDSERQLLSNIQTSNVLNDPNLNTRLAAIKAITTMPASSKFGELICAESLKPENANYEYVPRMPEVLQFIKLLNPGEDGTMQFMAPTTPGDYPFICTFPGHWRIMNGILRVTN
jgi:azurin